MKILKKKKFQFQAVKEKKLLKIVKFIINLKIKTTLQTQ